MAWEEESPGPSPKSLKKVSESPWTLKTQKSEKSLEVSPKSLERVQKWFFWGDFSDSPQGFSQTFRLLGFGPGDSQV